MEAPSVLLLGLLVLGLLASLIALGNAVVASGVSHMRLKLWTLHDRVVDDLVAGRYRNEEQAREVLAMIRTTIAHAREFTFLRVFGSYVLVRLSPHSTQFRSATKKSVLEGKADDERLNGQIAELVGVMAHYVFRTSLVGHVGTAIVPIVYVSYRRARHRTVPRRVAQPENLAERPIRVEVKREIILHKTAHARLERELAGVAC